MTQSVDAPAYSAGREGDWIQLISGEPFWPLDPRLGDIQIDDIAWALSMLCRYGGHVKRFYSVAEHCVMVSRIVPPEFALWALLHDATEAYLVDLPRPIKHCMPDYKKHEQRLERVIAERFNLPWPMPAEVKDADTRMLLVERDQLLAASRLAWGYPQAHTTTLAVGPLAPPRLECWKPGEARLEFLQRFDELLPF